MSDARARSAALERLYVWSVAAVLVLTALAKLYNAAGEARILALRDPLLPLTNRELLMAVGLIELAVAAYLVWGRSPVAKPLWVVWLSLNFVLYRLGVWWVAPGKPCPCLGTVTARLPWEPATVDWLLKLVIAYLLVGSLWWLASIWRQQQGDVKHGAGAFQRSEVRSQRSEVRSQNSEPEVGPGGRRLRTED